MATRTLTDGSYGSRTATRSRPKLTRLERERERWAFLFISPWIVGFFLFTLLPILGTLGLSFTDYNPVNPSITQFIGVTNYLEMFSDSKVGVSLLVTIRYAVLAIPVSFAVGL